MVEKAHRALAHLPTPLAADPRFAKLCDLIWENYQRLDLDKLLVYLIDLAADNALPYLAEQFSLTDEPLYSKITTSTARRRLIKQSIARHRLKGTPYAVRQILAVHGYRDCQIIEGRELLAQLEANGAEWLDGSNTLDGSSDLSFPFGVHRRRLHWAEYALRLNEDFNTPESEQSRHSLKEIAALCAAYAPARSRLAIIILFVRLHFELIVKMQACRIRIRTRLDHCRRMRVPEFDTLDGCDLIGGDMLPSLLDGSSDLDGASLLSGGTPIGDFLDGGQMSIRITDIRHAPTQSRNLNLH